ncbi:MAG TPA: hypothetical protein VGL86_21730 [Polyangia bacterium]|jgi:hypothetical protein
MKLKVHIRAKSQGKSDVVQAYCPDLPGCSASARNEAEALALLRARVEEYFATPTPVVPGTRVITFEV